MSRVDENQEVIENLENKTAENQILPFGEGILFQLGAIIVLIGDISKSLAVIADKMESEREE